MINQRILYVGIGGSGIDLGLELDAALKRDICGIDGTAVRQMGLDYAPYTLPPFVQQVYIDFEAAAVSGAIQRLRGSNVRTVTNIIPPTSNNFADAAELLRMSHPDLVRDWLPPRSNQEPSVNPLSAGAGQYPTVGRGALFESIRSQGLDQVITAPLRSAIADLSGSLGELKTCNQQGLNSVMVYVGFSLSGGTGCGVFYDVLLNLLKELEVLGEEVYVFPTVMCPSTFSGVLTDTYMNRAKLNAATAMVDLVGVVDQMGSQDRSTDGEFTVTYPGALPQRVSLGSQLSRVQLPAISTISLAPGMTRKDSVRILASAIVTQISTIGDSGGGGPKSFGGFVVNVMGDLKVANPHSVLSRPLMPMLSASLTVPSKKIAEILAKLLLRDFAREMSAAASGGSSSSDDEIADEILRYAGLSKLVNGDVFEGTYTLSFVPPTNKKDFNSRDRFNQRLQALRNQVDNVAIPVVQTEIDANLKLMVNFDLFAGMDQVLERHSDLTMNQLIRCANLALTKLNTLYEAPAQPSATRRPKAKGKSAKSMWVMKRPPQLNEVKAAYENVERDFKARVERMWWQKWADANFQWRATHENAQHRLADLTTWWSQMIAQAGQSAQEDQAELMQPREGIRDFIPTAGVPIEVAFENIYSNSRDDIRQQRQIQNASVVGLVQHVLGEKQEGAQSALQVALGLFKQNLSRHDFAEAILNPLKAAVNSTFSGPRPAFSSMEVLLKDMVSPSPSSDGVQLRTEIASLVPAVLIPPGESHKVKVVVTYPGQPDEAIKREVTTLVAQSQSMRSLLRIGAGSDAAHAEVPESLLTVQAVGDSDTLTININKVGQGIFENPEMCGVFESWKSELRRPMTDKVQWRQRRGVAKSHQVIAGQARVHLLNRIMLAFWDGRLTIAEGTLELPQVMSLSTTSGGTDDVAIRPQIHLEQGATGRGWSQVISAVEDLFIQQRGVVSNTTHVVRLALETIPADIISPNGLLRSGVVPDHILAFREFRASELGRLDAELTKSNAELPAVQREMLEVEKTFWTHDLLAAWKLPISDLQDSLHRVISLD